MEGSASIVLQRLELTVEQMKLRGEWSCTYTYQKVGEIRISDSELLPRFPAGYEPFCLPFLPLCYLIDSHQSCAKRGLKR